MLAQRGRERYRQNICPGDNGSLLAASFAQECMLVKGNRLFSELMALTWAGGNDSTG
jgi:hypothetical protein